MPSLIMQYKLVSIIWLGFYARLFLSMYFWFWGSRFTGNDQSRFHSIAQYLSNSLLDSPGGLDQWGMAYAYFLGFIYSLTTDSLLIGNTLATIAWLLSAYIFLKIMEMFSLSYKIMFLGIVLYVLFPSSLLNTSAGIREAYQLLFVNLSIYFALIYYYHRDVRALLLLFASAGLGATLHITFILSGLVLVILTLLTVGLRALRIRVFVALPFLFLASLAVFLSFSEYFSATIGFNPNTNLIQGVLSFQEGSVLTGADSRATYKVSVPAVMGVAESIGFLALGFFQYLFEPMPWKISSIFDVVLTLENLVRGVMLYLGIKALFIAKEEDKRVLLILLLTYLTIEFTFSVGTTNWGTAQRHHVPSLGLVLLLGLTFRNYFQKTENSSV